jgi:hypothetical protein
VLLLALLVTLTACGQAAGSGLGSYAARPAQAAVTPAAPSPAAGTTPLPGVPGFFPPRPPAPAQTPSGAGTPADPYSVFDPLDFVSGQTEAVLVKADLLNLDGHEPKDALLTVSSVPGISSTNRIPFASLPVTATRSALAVVAFDTVSQTWKIRFHTPDPGVPGRAVALPGSVQGQNLLRTDPPTPILQLRTETTPTLGSALPVVNLYLYAWKNGTAQPLLMRPAGATADQAAVFQSNADVQLIDIDNDGRAEVVVDDMTKTTIWKWDGTRFVPR